MICPKCQQGVMSIIPAEIRLYRNGPRTLAHPPMNPSPDVRVCTECGHSEFVVPRAWLKAGWLEKPRPAEGKSGAVLPSAIVALATT